jgi:hypothetical protein
MIFYKIPLTEVVSIVNVGSVAVVDGAVFFAFLKTKTVRAIILVVVFVAFIAFFRQLSH